MALGGFQITIARRTVMIQGLCRCLVVYVCAGTALAGVNEWTATGPEGSPAQAVAFHPTTPGVAFTVAGASIYRSADRGQTWASVREGVTVGLAGMVVDPSNPSRVMASTITALYRSDDGGHHFGAAAAPGSVSRLTVATDGVVYAATLESKVFRTVDFGAQWQDRSNGLPSGQFIEDLVVDPQDSSTLYALVDDGGLYRSTDAGSLWSQVDPFTNQALRKIAVDPSDSAQLLLATLDGLLSSEDGGESWAPLRAEGFVWVGYRLGIDGGGAVAIPASGPILHRVGRDAAWENGQALGVAGVHQAAFDPHDALTLLVATTEGPLLTQDGGASFVARNGGLRGGSVTALAASNDIDGTVYAAFATGAVGLHRRTTGGWIAADNVELKSVIGEASDALTVAVSPSDPAAVVVANGNRIVRSLDGGQSFSGPNPDLASVFVRSIAFDPSNAQLLYAGTDQHGIYKSQNQGVTWSPAPAQPFASVGLLAIDPSSGGTVFAAVHGPGGPPRLSKTSNGGEIWQPASAGLDVEWVRAISIDPSNGDTVFAGGIGDGEGLFKSTNGGATWARVGAPIGDEPGFSVVVDPLIPTTVFMTLFGSAPGAARSVDGGATWEPVPITAPGFPVPRRLLLDPLKPYNVLAAADNYGLVEIEISPDLDVRLVSAPSVIALGSTASATVRIVNHGPYAASAAKLTLSIPAGATAEPPTPPQGSCARQGADIECALGAMRVNDEIEVTVTLAAGNAPSPGTLAAFVSNHESDPVVSNDADAAAVAVDRIADLGLTLTADPSALDRASSLTLTAIATNAGPNASAEDTAVIFELDAGLAVEGATPSQGTCNASGGTITCVLGSMDVDTQATIDVALVAATAGTLTASAQLSASSADPSAEDASAAVSIASAHVANLGIELSADADTVVSGRPLRFDAVVSNAGPDDLPSATVVIGLVNATVSSASSGLGTCVAAGSGVTCTLGALARDATATVTVNATAGSAGTASATASVTFDGTDTDSRDDTATRTTTVSAPRSSGGGGGGPAELLALVALLAALRRFAVANLSARC
jgi:hypothetical protein